jgi:hypothetical protein
VDGPLQVLAELGVLLVDVADGLSNRPCDTGSGAFGCRSGSAAAAPESDGAGQLA